jgi:hypothetical protein
VTTQDRRSTTIDDSSPRREWVKSKVLSNSWMIGCITRDGITIPALSSPGIHRGAPTVTVESSVIGPASYVVKVPGCTSDAPRR